MCGLSGYFGSKILSSNKIKDILNSMKNRGPDAMDYRHYKLNNKNLYLFHSRLKIIDLHNRSNQPFEKHNKVILYNGEIYNFKEIRKKLVKKGYRFSTNSDTEVILSGYDYYGKKIFSLLNGMWSIVIFDKKIKKLIFSRDIFGEKPLYLSFINNDLIFGSEIKYLEEILSCKFKPNLEKIKTTFFQGYKSIFHEDRSFCDKIEMFSKNSISFFDLKKSKLMSTNFFKLNKKKKYIKNFSVAKIHVKKKLIESVKQKLVADVNCGVSLSGGIDSSVIAGIIKKDLKYNNIHYFSLIDKGTYNESALIKKTEKFLNIKVNKITVRYDDFLKRLTKLTRYYDSPISTITYFVQSQLIEKVKKKGVKVLLSGSGSDEQFTGYYDHFLQYYQDIKKTKNIKNFISGWKENIFPFIKNENLKKIDFYDDKKNKYKFIFPSNYENKKYLKFKRYKKQSEKDYNQSRLKNRMLNEIFHEITPVTLHHEDLNCMYNSVENRSPFLDKNLFNYTQIIDSSLLIKGHTQKFLLRETFRKNLHPEVYNFKQKIGFNASLYLFIKNENKKKLKNFFYEKSPINKLVNMKLLYNNIHKCKESSEFSKFLFFVISTKIFLDYRLSK